MKDARRRLRSHRARRRAQQRFWPDTFSCTAMNGLSRDAGRRLLRTCSANVGNRCHKRIRIGERFVLQPQWMKVMHKVRPKRDWRTLEQTAAGTCDRAQDCSAKRGRPRRNRCSSADVVAAKRPNVVQCSCLTAHHPVADHKIRIRGLSGLGLENRLVKPGRQRVDQIDIAGELFMLFARDAAGDEDTQMADFS